MTTWAWSQEGVNLRRAYGAAASLLLGAMGAMPKQGCWSLVSASKGHEDRYCTLRRHELRGAFLLNLAYTQLEVISFKGIDAQESLLPFHDQINLFRLFARLQAIGAADLFVWGLLLDAKLPVCCKHEAKWRIID